MDDAARQERERLLSEGQRWSIQDPARFTFGGKELAPERVVELLTPLMSEARLARIDAVLAGRTYTVAPVVEGLVNMGNVSAVMRSAEALGYQPFHVITGAARFKNSQRTSQGAEKWLDVFRWSSPEACAAYLKAEGYTIVATHLDETAVPIDEIDFTQKTALVFGNERDGVTPEMLSHSDRRCIIPMTGFVQSFNISVAAAVSLFHAYRDRLTRQGYHGDLTEEERASLRAIFCMRSVRNAEQILRRKVQEREG